MVVTLTMPNFEVFLIYSNEEAYGILPIFEGAMVFIVYLIQVVYLILYGSVFVNSKNKRFCLAGIAARACYYYFNAWSARSN